MRPSTIWFTLKQGVKNIKRNWMFSIASILTMAACIFLVGIFYSIVNFLMREQLRNRLMRSESRSGSDRKCRKLYLLLQTMPGTSLKISISRDLRQQRDSGTTTRL